jgi:hypothetical protein
MDPEAMCQFLVDGTGPMAADMEASGMQMSANEDGTTQTFCSMPTESLAALATMSADDEAADPSGPRLADEKAKFDELFGGRSVSTKFYTTVASASC